MGWEEVFLVFYLWGMGAVPAIILGLQPYQVIWWPVVLVKFMVVGLYRVITELAQP